VTEIPQVLLGSGLAAVIVAVLNAIIQRRKISADTTKVLSDVSVGMLGPLRGELERLHADLAAAEEEVDHLRQELRKLADELRRERRQREAAEMRLKMMTDEDPL
jgi:predicted  nucleic acid-binding Zn-ribbon protein